MLVRLYLECSVHFWLLQYKKDTEALKECREEQHNKDRGTGV